MLQSMRGTLFAVAALVAAAVGFVIQAQQIEPRYTLIHDACSRAWLLYAWRDPEIEDERQADPDDGPQLTGYTNVSQLQSGQTPIKYREVADPNAGLQGSQRQLPEHGGRIF